jgi:hypothetical protein
VRDIEAIGGEAGDPGSARPLKRPPRHAYCRTGQIRHRRSQIRAGAPRICMAGARLRHARREGVRRQEATEEAPSSPSSQGGAVFSGALLRRRQGEDAGGGGGVAAAVVGVPPESPPGRRHGVGLPPVSGL